MLYVLSGTIEVTINDQSKELKQGDLAMVFPNTIHRFDACNSQSPCRILLVICSLNLTGEYFKTITRYYPTNPFILCEDLHENVAYALGELDKERYALSDRNVCSALLQLIFARVIPKLPLEKNKDIQNYDLTYKIISYVSEHFQENISLTELALHLNVCKYYLSRVFSKKLHTSFNKYINDIRLNYALTLIQSTDFTLTQISNEAGFESQRTFNRAFKEVYGLSPSIYRKKSDQTIK
jgi:AraC-like DNA-binding protein